MDILEIKNVAYSYANSKEKVLSGVNQKFELGKFYAIVGKSGTGKSTLLSLLAHGARRSRRGVPAPLGSRPAPRGCADCTG